MTSMPVIIVIVRYDHGVCVGAGGTQVLLHPRRDASDQRQLLQHHQGRQHRAR